MTILLFGILPPIISTMATLSGLISIQYILPLLLVSHHAHSCFRTLEENACNKFPRVPEKSAGIICHLNVLDKYSSRIP